jgi:flagellar FliL protein
MAAAKKKEKKDKKAEAEETPAPANDTGDAPAAEGEGGEGDGKSKKKMSGKTLVLFVILPAILVLGAAGGAAFMLLGHGNSSHAEQHAEASKEKGKGAGDSTPGPNGTTISHGENVVFVTMPDMLVNITGPDGHPGYLKLKLTLEAPNDQAVSALTAAVPRISDEFNGFLRELRTDDLVGSAGAYRLRLELLRRVNLVIAPQQINAVLIEEMLVQ